MAEDPIDEELLKAYTKPWVDYIKTKTQRELDDWYAKNIPPKEE